MAQQLHKGLSGGFKAAVELMKQRGPERYDYGRSVFYDPAFQQGLRKAGITAKETPGAFLGAYAARLGGDVVTDESRKYYWRLNHPLAIADEALQRVVDPQYTLGPYAKGVIGLAAIQPAAALTGAYNPLNISELGRPTGYKQNVPTSEDPTKTEEPATELFQRFIQGRTGRPLAYEKAKEEIPTLTKQRYANYMNFLYNDPGPIGKATLGLVKVTPENLQGNPEARVLGYPVNIPAVTALAGGLAGARLGVNTSPSTVTTVQPSLFPGQAATVTKTIGKRTPAILRGAVGSTIGSAAGAVVGVLSNQAIAAAGNSMNKLPTQQEYQNISAGRI